MKRIFVSLALLFSALAVVPAQAAKPNVMVEYLIKLGKIYYDKGQYVSAIHEFTKAVMIDPENKEAQDYLRKLGTEGGYFGRSEKQVFDVTKMADEVERYKKEYEKKAQTAKVLELDKKALKDMITVKDTENAGLRAEIQQIKKDYTMQSAKDHDVMRHIENTANQKGREITRLSSEMTHLNTRISVVNQQISAKQAENAELQAKIKSVQQEAKDQTAKDQAQLKQMELVLKNKSQEIARLADEKKALNDRLAMVKESISTKELENVGLRDKIKKIQLAARQQAEEDSAALKKAENTIQNKEQEIARLNTDAFKLKDQIVAKLALLKEKESMLKNSSALTQNFQEKERGWQAKSADYEKEIQKLSQVFDRYQQHRDQSDVEYNEQIKKLQEVIRKNRLELAFLNDRLVFTEYKLVGRDSQLSGNQKVIAELKNSLFSIEKELAAFQAKSVGKGKDLNQITKKIESDIEKDKLIKAKDRAIMELKMKLAQAREEVNTLGKSQEKLAALKDNLDRIKQQLEARQSPFAKGDFDTSLLEAQIREIQEKLKVVEGLMNDKVDEDKKENKTKADNLT